MDTSIVPLAITMMAGPQILSAIIFATSKKPIKASAAFTLGVAIAVTLGVFITTTIASAIGAQASSGTSEPSTAAQAVQIGLVALLIFAAFRSYRKRETIKPPKWLGKLQGASPRRAFEVGALLILFFPSDLVILITTGIHLASKNLDVVAALPFIALTTLIAALPLLGLVLFHKKAVTAVPAIRKWMNDSVWLVNIIVYVIFIFLILD
ncbi:GAP family protein [Patescibacteria group bacterium]|nr:GAP family protein [Patescibacteria group bacterium]